LKMAQKIYAEDRETNVRQQKLKLVPLAAQHHGGAAAAPTANARIVGAAQNWAAGASGRAKGYNAEGRARIHQETPGRRTVIDEKEATAVDRVFAGAYGVNDAPAG
jgi:hypothetical protein